MNKSLKTLLVVEFIFCFFTPGIFLFMGWGIIVPGSLKLLSTQGFFSQGFQDALGPVLQVLGGSMGVFAAASVLAMVMESRAATLNTKLTWFLIAAGFVSLITYVFPDGTDMTSEFIGLRIILLLPLFCGAHLIYLARDKLFIGKRQGVGE